MEIQNNITDISFIADKISEKLKELNSDYGLKSIVFEYTTKNGYRKQVTVEV